jgi:ATP-dependent DNA helicase RecG
MLPYKGLGSGIKRALDDWPEIDFTDDREGNLFTATVHRKEVDRSLAGNGQANSQRGSQKSSQKVVEIMRNKPEVTIAELAIQMGISDRAIKKQITKLKQQHLIRRIGPDKGGHWEVSD